MDARSRTLSSLRRSTTLRVTKSQPRSLLSIARLKRARSRRLPASSRRARMAQTCLGSNGRFYPTRRPLFQALRFWVTAGSWTLGMICPPSVPPSQNISTALTQYLSLKSYGSLTLDGKTMLFCTFVQWQLNSGMNRDLQCLLERPCAHGFNG